MFTSIQEIILSVKRCTLHLYTLYTHLFTSNMLITSVLMRGEQVNTYTYKKGDIIYKGDSKTYDFVTQGEKVKFSKSFFPSVHLYTRLFLGLN